jgi:hypothetical protein
MIEEDEDDQAPGQQLIQQVKRHMQVVVVKRGSKMLLLK